MELGCAIGPGNFLHGILNPEYLSPIAQKQFPCRCRELQNLLVSIHSRALNFPLLQLFPKFRRLPVPAQTRRIPPAAGARTECLPVKAPCLKILTHMALLLFNCRRSGRPQGLSCTYYTIFLPACQRKSQVACALFAPVFPVFPKGLPGAEPPSSRRGLPGSQRPPLVLYIIYKFIFTKQHIIVIMCLRLSG